VPGDPSGLLPIAGSVENMEKSEIGLNVFIPMPVVLVGTQVAGKANFMAVGWITRANGNPPMIACGIGNHHFTTRGIAETKTFSVNIPCNHKNDHLVTTG
jgi:flavin reductase (DIM6/NTAB) family NADH-FMN oxidoreductase RutF